MSKHWFGTAILAAVAFLAVACGSSPNFPAVAPTTPTTLSFTGAIDSTVLSAADMADATVTLTKADDSTVSYTATVTTSGNTETDHTYTATGIVDSGSYIAMVSDSTNGAELLKSLVTVGSSSDKARFAKTVGVPQINVVTTLVVTKAIAAAATGDGIVTLALVQTELQDVFGATVTSLDAIVVDGGEVKTSTGTAAITDPVALSAVNYMAMAVKATAQLTDSTAVAQATAAIASLTTATTIDAIATASTAVSTTLAAVPAEAVAAVLSSIASSAGQFATSIGLDTTATTISANVVAVAVDALAEAAVKTTLIILNTTDSSVLGDAFVAVIVTAGGNVDSAVEDVAVEVANNGGTVTVEIPTPKVTYFGLADASYGTQMDSAFTVGTLSPVFKVMFEKEVVRSVVSGNVTVDVMQDSTSLSLDSSTTLVTYTWASSKELLIAVNYDSARTSLEPGAMYTYEIMADAGVDITSLGYTGGTITTMDVTLTSPSVAIAYAGTDWMGLSTDADISFWMHSAYPITLSGNAPLYGILGSNGVLSVEGAPSSASSSDVTVTGITEGATETSMATITIAASATSVGSHTLTISGTLSSSDSAAPSEITYPTSVKIDVK